jgi:hypothetical protein
VSEDLGFHYKREERLGMRGAPQPGAPGRRLLPGGRRPLVLVVNVVLIVALFVLYGRSRVANAESAELQGWRVALRGIPAGNDVLAVLEASASGTAAGAAGGARIYVVFRAGEAELRLSEALPADGGSVALSGRLVEAGTPSELTAEVSIGDAVARLRRSLSRD